MRLGNLHTRRAVAPALGTVIIRPGGRQQPVFAGKGKQVLFHRKGVGGIKNFHAVEAGFGPGRKVPVFGHDARVRDDGHAARAFDVLDGFNGGYPGGRNVARLAGDEIPFKPFLAAGNDFFGF